MSFNLGGLQPTGDTEKMEVLQVINQTRDKMVGDRVEIADTSISRMIGLLGRRRLSPGEGLWIRPSSGVHTVGMRFPIDVIGLDKHQRVIKLWKHLRPYRVTSVSAALRSVVELPSGRIAECEIELGDLLQFKATRP